ncbi:hypothetical protein XH93_35065 [Bradyrhizobium sp. CCBAU 51753]|nr:hypothetical protein XH93_35065 [Bradyrhizobium sp. CCBAU 51753]
MTKPSRMLNFTSPRLRGEVGSHRRCDPGEGGSPRIDRVDRAPHPNLLPVKDGERGRSASHGRS